MPDTMNEQIPLHIDLLGGFRVRRGGMALAESAWQRPSGKTLVKLLALDPAHRLHREQILDLLWPDADPEVALRNFRKVLHFARQALDGERSRAAGPFLVVRDDLVALAPEVEVDVDTFERLARRALAETSVAGYEAALAAYPGELLPEDRYQDWTLHRREELTQLVLQLLDRLAQELADRGAYQAAITAAQRMVQLDPLREEAHRRLMQLYAQSGNTWDALRQYETCRRLLADELGVEPEPETDELYREIVTGGVREEGAPATVAAVRRAATTPFIGREHATALVQQALQRAEAGHGGMVLVAGEVGVGKTRLAEEVATGAAQQGVTVLWGASYEGEGVLPYGPLVEALDAPLARLSDAEKRRIVQSSPVLGLFLPALRPPAPAAEAALSGLPGERARLVTALSGLLTAMALRSPVLLVLDDLHAADAETLQVIQHLARLAPERRWLLLGTYREENLDAGSELHQLVVASSRRALAHRVHLLRLSRTEAASLAQALLPGGSVGADLLDALQERSLGNPLFLEELIAAWREQEAVTLSEGTWRLNTPAGETVPRLVGDLIEVRVGRLGRQVRQVLALAAAAGPQVTFAELRAAAQDALVTGDAELVDALEQALEAHVLDEHDGAYVFRHPLYRATLYGRTTRTRRQQLHRSLAGVIERQRPDDVEALAYHWAQAGEEEQALAYRERAGDRALAVYAYDAARTHYERLVEQKDSPGAREKLGLALLRAGRFDEAVPALEAAAAAYRVQGAWDDECRAVARIGYAHMRRAAPAEGIARVEALLALAPTLSSGLAALLISLAYLYFSSGRYQDELATIERAIETARAVGDERLLLAAEQRLGSVLMRAGRSEEGLVVLGAVIPRLEEAQDLDGLVRALNNVSGMYQWQGAMDQARSYTEQALACAERLGDTGLIAFMMARLALVQWYLGDWDAALRSAEKAVSLVQQLGVCWEASWTRTILGLVHLHRGDREEGLGALNQVLAAAGATNDIQELRAAGAWVAEWETLEGRPEVALALLAPVLDQRDEGEWQVTMILHVYAFAHLEAGNVAEAEAIIADAIRRIDPNHHTILADARRVEAMILARQGREKEAEEVLREVVTMARTIPFPYAEARALCEWGRVLMERGEIDQARARLDQAATIFRRLGAGPAVEKTSRVAALAADQSAHRARRSP